MARTTAPTSGASSGALPTGGATAANRRRLLVIAMVLSAVVLVPMFVVQPATVSGDSMQPTLHGGQHVVIDKITYRFRSPRRGELVVTADPDGHGTIVKRVVAVGGDSVGIEDGLLVLNGAIVKEPYTDQSQMDGYFNGPITVPAGFVFVLGDHRNASVDSRRFGALPAGSIHGRVVARW
jgi:signal peptidase I